MHTGGGTRSGSAKAAWEFVLSNSVVLVARDTAIHDSINCSLIDNVARQPASTSCSPIHVGLRLHHQDTPGSSARDDMNHWIDTGNAIPVVGSMHSILGNIVMSRHSVFIYLLLFSLSGWNMIFTADEHSKAVLFIDSPKSQELLMAENGFRSMLHESRSGNNPIRNYVKWSKFLLCADEFFVIRQKSKSNAEVLMAATMEMHCLIRASNFEAASTLSDEIMSKITEMIGDPDVMNNAVMPEAIYWCMDAKLKLSSMGSVQNNPNPYRPSNESVNRFLNSAMELRRLIGDRYANSIWCRYARGRIPDRDDGLNEKLKQ